VNIRLHSTVLLKQDIKKGAEKFRELIFVVDGLRRIKKQFVIRQKVISIFAEDWLVGLKFNA
jgi:hypothetical protein